MEVEAKKAREAMNAAGRSNISGGGGKRGIFLSSLSFGEKKGLG